MDNDVIIQDWLKERQANLFTYAVGTKVRDLDSGYVETVLELDSMHFDRPVKVGSLWSGYWTNFDRIKLEV